MEVDDQITECGVYVLIQGAHHGGWVNLRRRDQFTHMPKGPKGVFRCHPVIQGWARHAISMLCQLPGTGELAVQMHVQSAVKSFLVPGGPIGQGHGR